jgi:hypothetical protein
MAASLAACTYPGTNPGVEITNRALDALDNSAYNEYLKDAAQINFEREKAGLAPAPILTRQQWAGKK